MKQIQVNFFDEAGSHWKTVGHAKNKTEALEIFRAMAIKKGWDNRDEDSGCIAYFSDARIPTWKSIISAEWRPL